MGFVLRSILVLILIYSVIVAAQQTFARDDGNPPVHSAATEPSREAVTIHYRNGAFVPKVVTVEVGWTVAFSNESDQPFWPASNIHPTHHIYPEFDAKGSVPPGESWTFTFDRPGTWRYHNHLFPEAGGGVSVQGQEAVRANRRETLDPHTIEFQPLPPLSLDTATVLFEEDEPLEQHILQYGPANTVKVLSASARELGKDCHHRAHIVGRLSYGLFGSEAFSVAGHECQSGVYHGTMEALFRDQGTANLKEDVATICSLSRNGFFRHQCVHGVGHGLMAWTNYGLPEALDLCHKLNAPDQESCYSGVFMENVVGGLSGSMGHTTKYLSDDLHYPCNSLEDRYVSGCYFFQTSHMVKLTGGDFARVTEACQQAPETAQLHCFGSMGRDVGAHTRGEPARAIRFCSYVADPSLRRTCLSRVVQNWFWEASGATAALDFCRLLKEEDDKRDCYETVITRAVVIYEEPTDVQSFCGKVEQGYRSAPCANPTPTARQENGQKTVRPEPYELDQLYTDTKERCPDRSIHCYETVLLGITGKHGPGAALDVFRRLQSQGEVKETRDGHHVAHHIGHHAAMTFGPHAEALGLCPTDFNYGCIHGFFQQALGQDMASPEIVMSLCDERNTAASVSLKDRTYCYHGLGHGIMMYADYDLDRALGLCDGIENDPGRMGCWQGLFMENVNGAMQGQWQRGGFSLEDPLAPCNQLLPAYQHECFINHAGWMMQLLDNDPLKVVQACARASADQRNVCIESLSLMATNPGWQDKFLANADTQSLLKNAHAICETYPEEWQQLCLFGGVDNLLNFDHLDLTRAAEFCGGADREYRQSCFQRIGSNVRNLAADHPSRRVACQTLEPGHRESCLSGAGVTR